MNKINHGIIHVHTENSMKDSVLSPQRLCEKASQMGAPAIVLTDHGVLTGVYEFMHAASEYGIKGIPGVEAYVQEDESLIKRKHLLLIPKNYTGYKAISKAVTLSNNNLIRGYPCVNMEILKECFAEGTEGHGNVFATSACVGGVLAQILLKKKFIEQEMEKITAKMKNYNNPNDPAYIANVAECEKLNSIIKTLMENKSEMQKIASRKFKLKERRLCSLEASSEEYKILEKEIAEQKKQAENAVIKVGEINKEIAALNSRKKIIKEQCKEAEKTHSRWNAQNAALNRLADACKSNEDLYSEAKQAAKEYEKVFGKNNFYIELQYHRIQDEKYVMPILAKLADELNLPIVACNDIHYAESSDKDIRARQIVSSLRYNKWEPLREGDTEYYIKSDEELSNILCEILPNEVVKRAMEGIGSIIDNCNIVFPKGTHFPKFETGTKETAVEKLRRMTKEGIAKRYSNDEWTPVHQQRLDYELSIIEEQGYSDYFCIVEDFLNYARKKGKENPEKVGLSVGPGRGSVVGSLVAYLVGITGIDPLKYDLIFERFLNRDRVSFPDIDSDFDINIRDLVLRYVQEKYGKDAVCGIATKGRLAARAAIRNVARVTGDEKFGDRTAFYNIGDDIANAIPKVPGIQLSDVEKELKEKFATNKIALSIIEDAKLVEGAALQYSTHAAGVIIADNGNVSEYVPLMKNDDNTWVCQCNMVEAESDAGLLKMDFLGLRNLNIISETLRAIKRNYGISLDMEAIGQSLKDGIHTPYDKKGNVFADIFSKGRTNGVFQFESSGMKTMLKQFQPSNINDIILLVAAYRPGPIESLSDIISVKRKEKKPEYVIPEMETVLGNTYGYPIYQEQIMQIFNKFAGFTLGESDIIRRYMSKKKVEKFAAYKDKFIAGLISNGADQQKAEDFWEHLLKFSKYAFNKSHACAYAFVAYYTAWLKLNYPVEYMTALLNYTETKKLPSVINECNEIGVKVLLPDINFSQVEFTTHNGDILFGLGSIKGIKNNANTIIETRAKERFHSFKDFICRVDVNKSVIENCIYSGALDCWCNNRFAMFSVYPEIKELHKKKRESQLNLETNKEKIRDVLHLDSEVDITSELLNEALEKKLIKKTDVTQIKKYEEKIRDYNDAIEIITIPINSSQDKNLLLEKENELIGMYVSGHPLEEYENIKDIRTCAICDAEIGNITLCGVIKNLRNSRRKSDGSPMAFFTLSDETGNIAVNCFVRAYAENEKCISEGNVVAVKGRCIIPNSGYDEEDNLELNAQEIKMLHKTKQNILISVKNIAEWTDYVYDEVIKYIGKDYGVFVHDQMTGEIRETTGLTVSADILNSDIDGTSISVFA